MSSTTDQMDIRIPANDVRVGDLLVRAGKREINSTVTEVKPLPAGSIVYGPRGGRYRTRYAETVIKTRSGQHPVIYNNGTVTVFRSN